MSTDNQPEKKSNITRNILIVLAVIALIIILYYACFYVFTDSYGIPIKDAVNAINGIFGAISVGGLIITIILQSRELELQRQELRDNRLQLTRTANAQEGSNEFFNEQLRLSVIPIFITKMSYYHDSTTATFHNSFIIKNKGSDSFHLDVSILYENKDGKRQFARYDSSFFREDEVIMFRFDKKWKDFYIKINYYDVLKNEYTLIVQNHPLEVYTEEDELAMLQTPAIPDPKLNKAANTTWQTIINEKEYFFNKTLIKEITKTT